MIILSIYPWTNTSSAALSINGKIVSASPEERFNRVKGSSDFPINAINWCLKEHKLSWKNIDAVAIAWNPSKNIKSASSRWINNMRWRGEFLSNVPAQIMKMINYESDNHLSIFFDRQKIFFLNHHECHAASAFFASPFKNSDILTIDGHGENETCFMGYGRSNKIIKKNSIPYPHSVGLFYGTFTDYLGFKPDSDEWKAMSEDAKAKYEQMCTEDKERYNKEMTAYNKEKKENEEKNPKKAEKPASGKKKDDKESKDKKEAGDKGGKKDAKLTGKRAKPSKTPAKDAKGAGKKEKTTKSTEKKGAKGAAAKDTKAKADGKKAKATPAKERSASAKKAPPTKR